MKKKQKQASAKLNEEESMILGPFVDFAQQGEDELAEYLTHCGIDGRGIQDAGSTEAAVLARYRKPDGTPDIDAAAHDLMRWPPIAARVKELKRDQRRQGDKLPI